MIARKKRTTAADIKAWLRKQSRDSLVEIIMDQAGEDEDFFDLLKFRLASATPSEHLTDMREVIERAMEIEDFVSYRGAYDYSCNVERALNQVKALLEQHPAAVIELTEHAMDCWEAAIQYIDDSDGGMGMILDDLHELHFEACQKAKPDPVELAETLFHRCLESEWDLFRGAYDVYGDVLGDAGKARYQELAEAEWRKLPRIKPGRKDPNRYGLSSKLDDMMLEIAADTGDLERIIEVMSRDLSMPYDFLQIADRCRKDGSSDLARQWAEKGVKAFPGHGDTRLHEFLADQYVREKRHEDAVKVAWDMFAAQPTAKRYRHLMTYARKAKAESAWRTKALDFVRADIAKQRKKQDGRQSRWQRPVDNSLLVEIMLGDKDIENAWQEAQAGGCSELLWLQLAQAREADHPEDAVAIYRRQIEPLLSRKNNQSYEEAVAYLGRIHTLMARLGKADEFKRDLQSLKTEWKRLRNFIKYVERKKWGRDV